MNTTDGVIERELDAGEKPTLVVRSHAGEIAVRGWGRNTIRVRATGDDDELESHDLSLKEEGGRFTVGSQGGPGGNLSIDYQIDVPRHCDVEIHSVHGDVSVEDTVGRVTVDTPAGDVTLADLDGECHVNTANGDVTGTSLLGALFFRTASGDAEISASRLLGLDVESANGDLTVGTSLQRAGQYRFHTVSGDMQLLVPPDTRATVHLDTQNGDVAARLPIEVVHTSRRRWEGHINGGGVLVQMRSVTGDLEIESTEMEKEWRSHVDAPVHRTPQPVLEPVGAGEASGSAAILEALSRGEIGIDDAMTQLEGLGN